MLERRDTEGEIDGTLREGKSAQVALDELEAGNLGARDIHAGHAARSEREQSRKVGGLGVCRAEVENVSLAPVTAERPANLDRSLVDPSRCAQVARTLLTRAVGACRGDCVVERSYAQELRTRDHLLE